MLLRSGYMILVYYCMNTLRPDAESAMSGPDPGCQSTAPYAAINERKQVRKNDIEIKLPDIRNFKQTGSRVRIGIRSRPISQLHK